MNDFKIYEEKRPWGYFRRFCQNTPATVKIIGINPNEELSLQSHSKRREFWRILAGNGFALIGEREQPVKSGDELLIPQGEKHRLSAGADGLQILEISFGDFDEEDIIRYEDKYGRI